MKKNFFNLQIIAWLLVLSSLFCFNINPVWADEQPEYNRASVSYTHLTLPTIYSV